MDRRPNLLYLHSHDTGRYIQPYGYPVSTPNLQRLAEAGVLFRNSFAVSPTCSPSRSALLTGMYPHNNGMTGLAHRGWSMTDYNRHIIHRLRPHGYSSWLIGTQHIIREDQVDRIGYDTAKPHLKTRDRVSAAVEYLSQAPSQPFFLSVGFWETHREYRKAEPNRGGSQEDSRYVRPPAPLPDTERTRQDMAAYAATVRYLDQCYGVILDALERAQLTEKTLVICTTDHGIAFPGMKCTLTDHGLGVLMILRGPGGFSGGKVVDAMVTHLDILPTVYELLDLPATANLQGSSLLPLVLGNTDQIHEAIFGEINYHAAYDPQRSVRTTRYKYIRRFSDRETPALVNCDDSLSKDEWVRHGWGDRVQPQELLFDLVFDPNETSNLAYNEDYQSVLEFMRDKLTQWMKSTNDPLLKGPVPAPEGAQINDPDAISPEEPARPAS